MDKIYNSFYIQEDEANSSQENDCFQAWDVEKSLSEGSVVQNFKNIDKNGPATQSTFYNNTLSAQFEQFTIETKEKPAQNTINEREQGEINSKRKIQKPFNQIETSIYCLEKTVKSYRGQAQETVNLNKYYSKCLRDYVETLAVCHIVEPSEISTLLQKLKNNELDSLQMQGQMGENCAKYVKSPHIINKILMSSKMNFNSKLMAVKYIRGFQDKVIPGNIDRKIWKKDKI